MLHEEKRDHFLDKLEKIQASTEADKKEKRENFVDKNFLRMYECIKENLEDINNQEFMLSAELNEEYDDWYGNDSEEFIYIDPEELLPMIDEACDFVHRCIDMEAFSYGYDIAERLSVLEVAAENEYTDEDLFTLSELMRGHHLIPNSSWKTPENIIRFIPLYMNSI